MYIFNFINSFLVLSTTPLLKKLNGEKPYEWCGTYFNYILLFMIPEFNFNIAGGTTDEFIDISSILEEIDKETKTIEKLKSQLSEDPTMYD